MSPLGKQLAELSGKGSLLPCSGDSQVVGNISGWLHALWPPLPSLSFPPLYYFQKMEDQSFVFTATHRLILLPVYPYRGAPWARGCLPPPHGLPETSGMWQPSRAYADPATLPGNQGAGRSPRSTQMSHGCLHHLKPETTSVCAATPWCGDQGCFSMVWSNESCCSGESLKFPPCTLAKWFPLCFPVLPSTVPTHPAEVHFWSRTFI